MLARVEHVSLFSQSINDYGKRFMSSAPGRVWTSSGRISGPDARDRRPADQPGQKPVPGHQVLRPDPGEADSVAGLQQDRIDRHGEQRRFRRGVESDAGRIGLHQRQLGRRVQGSQEVDLRSGTSRPHCRWLLENDSRAGGIFSNK